MSKINERNMEFVSKTEELLDGLKSTIDFNLPIVKSQFSCDALLWNNITVKLMSIYYDLYNSLLVLEENERETVEKNIIETLEALMKTDDYKYFETVTLNIYRDIKDDVSYAYNFGIISEEEKNTLLNWLNSETREILLVRENIIENFRYVNLEFSYHNHFMRLDGVHFNGLTNDIFINRILDRMYENDTSCAQIIKAQIEDKGFYSRRVANILSDGTMIELYLEFNTPDGCGFVRFIRSGLESSNVSCFNKQEGFEASPEYEEKDVVVERCMNELFNIMQIVEAL